MQRTREHTVPNHQKAGTKITCDNRSVAETLKSGIHEASVAQVAKTHSAAFDGSAGFA